MAIRVTCSSCHARFDVSEKFAGKEGPCPKCKTTIKIPTADEQVVVHAPEHSGPKDSKGRSVLKPISRSETVLSAVQITLIVASVLGSLIVAFALRNAFPDKENFPILVLAIGSLLLAGPLAYVAYTFLRNQESPPFVGTDLYGRIGICGAVYALLWLVMPLMGYAFPGEGSNHVGSVIGLVAMIIAGGSIATLVLEFDYLLGTLHFGMYLVMCLTVRLVIGLEILPGAFESGADVPSTVISQLHAWSTLLF